MRRVIDVQTGEERIEVLTPEEEADRQRVAAEHAAQVQAARAREEDPRTRPDVDRLLRVIAGLTGKTPSEVRAMFAAEVRADRGA